MHSAKTVCLVCIAFFVLSACSPIGERYADVDGIKASSSWDDWVVVGAFGAKGPFKLDDVQYCEVSEPCEFSHNGQGHIYNNFIGFKLAVLRLRSDQNEVAHVVLRSVEKLE